MPSASLTIRNIPARVLRRLRDRAAEHRRSMQGEVLSILEAAAADAAVRVDAEDLQRRVQSLGLKTPAEAVAMIREDRDGRRGR